MRAKDDINNLVFYLFADHLGSTNVVTDPSGGMVSLNLYTPWGESRGGDDADGLRVYWTVKQQHHFYQEFPSANFTGSWRALPLRLMVRVTVSPGAWAKRTLE